MAEQEKKDISIPIEARIKAAKGTKIGDDLVNPLEQKLYDDIVTEHGNVMSDTKETMNKEFLSLIEDVGDLSEGNQRRLAEVAKMLGVTLQEKDGGLQMNYELFQKILKFQKEHEMKLTGVVDDTLYQALKKHAEEEKKADTPATPAEAEKKTDTPYTGYTPQEKETTREEKINSIASKPYINSDSAYPVGIQESATTEPVPVPVESGKQPTEPYERILPPPVPVTPTGIASVGAEAGVKVAPTVATSEGAKTPVATPVETAPTTQEKPTIKALPVEEAEAKTEEVKKIITEEGKKLGITINGLEISESPLGQEIVDMILYYEGPGGSRQPDVGGYDIGGGINTGSSVEEKKYALGENYAAWNGDFIPKENVRECVLRLLNVRIALTKKSCTDKGIDFDSLPQNVKGVLVDLHYNMPNNINGFKKFWGAIKEKNWQEAGKQLVDNGSGGPSGYLNQVQGRAYANALMLANGDTNYAEYKREGEKIGGGAELLNQYNQKVGEYGKKVGMGERKEIVKNAENAGDIITQTTSTDVLSTNGSTKSVTKILDKYLQEHPEKQEEMIQILRNQIGNFSEPIEGNPEKIGAYQQFVYLSDPVRFAAELRGIDGDYGPLTSATYMKDVYAINGTAMLAKITDAASLVNLTPFEREVLQKNLGRDTASVGATSSAEEIRKAQILLALNGELGALAIDGKWTPELEKLSIPSLSSEKQFLTAEAARTILSRKYKITSSTMDDDPGDSKATNRTGLVGLRDCAVGGAINLANELGNPDGLRITGGTEDGHSGNGLFGRKEYTHGNGYKLDFGYHPELERFTGLSMGQKVTKYIKGQEVLFYRHEPDHFDVTFYPVK